MITMDASAGQKLEPRELRSFGLSTGTIVAVLFGALIPWIWDLRYPVWPWAVLVILGVWALTHPKSLWPVYKLWMRIALLISKITTPALLGIVFFLVILPLALLFRVFRRDPLCRQFDPDTRTYRIITDRKSVGSLENPY